MTYNEIITEIGKSYLFDDDDIREQVLTLVSQNRNYLSEDDFDSIKKILHGDFSDNGKFTAIEAICDN